MRQLKLDPRMTRIKLVVSDVDGTLVTHDKRLTDRGQAPPCEKLRAAGIGFTIVSSRPTVGMEFLIKPLALSLPFGSFNGSAIVDPQLRPIEQHLIPPETARAQRSSCSNKFGVEIWLFTNDQWLIRDPDGEYVGHEQRAIHHDADRRRRFRAPSRPGLQDRRRQLRSGVAGSVAKRRCSRRSARRPPPFARRPIISTSRRPATTRAPSWRRWRRGSAFRVDEVATIGDMQNDLPMFARSGMSFAMGNAADEIKRHATHVTASNEEDGFAKAMEDFGGAHYVVPARDPLRTL